MKRLSTFFAFLLAAGVSLMAQGVQISGTVTSAADGSALPGVSVVVEGTTIGTVTDFNGAFELEVPERAKRIVFSFVGMATQYYELDPSNAASIQIVMKEDHMALDEIIVTGYSRRLKNSITGSTVQVRADDFQDVPVTSIDQALQGKVAGLTIASTSGTPGSLQNIRIRGTGSIAASNEPLIVIDGVPVINGNRSGSKDVSTLSALSSINNSDIETATILKDASATSAYGARGSNGVIVITTKKGRAGKTRFSVNSSYGFQNKATRGKDVLTGAQREKLFYDAVFNSYGAAEGFSREETPAWAQANLEFAEIYSDWRSKGALEENWELAMRNKDAALANLVVSASGGDKKSSFYASAGYNKTEATVVGAEYQRVSGALNYSRDLSKRIHFSSSNKVSNTRQDGLILEQSAFFANPHLAKYFMSPILQARNEDGTAKTDNPTNLYNWLYLKDHDVTYNNMTRALSNNYLEWDIIDNLTFKTLMSVDFILSDYKSYSNRNYGDAEPENGTSDRSFDQNFNYVLQNSLAYNLYLNDHHLNFLALMEYQKNKRDYIWAYGENFATDGLTNVASAGANFDATSSYYDWMNLSYLGMVNYSYQSKYIADVTFRREGSSKFATDQRFGNFWSVGAAWNIIKESFLSDVSWLSNLRARASYGISGNSDLGINKYQALLAYNADYFNQGAVYPKEFGNAFLTWEKNTNLDLGLDFGFVDGRLYGSFSYYTKLTYDLLQEVPLTRTSGHKNITQNVGSVVNSGVEGILNIDVVRSKDFNLNLTANFATVNNEVTELAKDAVGKDINIETGYRKIEVGHSIYEWNLRKWAGVDPDNGDPLWYLSADSDETTNDYNAAEKQYLGKSALPTYTGGFGMHADYVGFFFDVNFYFAGGHMVYEDWSKYTHDNGLITTYLFNGVSGLTNSWTTPGQVTDYPKMLYDFSPNFAAHPSSRFLYDGDYIRMKDLVFGYNLPQSLLKKIKFSQIQVYVRGTNLFTWVKDDRLEYDPEVRADGFTYLTTPPTKSVIFGVNFKF